MATKPCACCGTHFQCDPRRGARKYCSQECAKVVQRKQNADCGRRRYHEVRGARSAVSFPDCSVCGNLFCSRRSPRAHDINVCPACRPEYRRLAHNNRMRNCLHTRRARLRNAFVERVDPQQVFARDGFRCHLCKKRTKPNKQVPHPKAPTIDHVIPLASGGTHEPSNVRTACFLCNTAKGNRGGGEQLLLIG